MKRGNRRCEHLLREAELWCTAASLRTGAPYPYDELRSCWETVLLLQFHDILPGSSIGWVHREAAASYTEIEQRLQTLVNTALAKCGHTPAEPALANASPFPRAEVVRLPGRSSTGEGVSQDCSDGTVAVWAVAAPSS